MKKDVVLDDFRKKCEELNLELLSNEISEDRVLVGCNLHNSGAWVVGIHEITLKNKLANCADCFSVWLKKNA